MRGLLIALHYLIVIAVGMSLLLTACVPADMIGLASAWLDADMPSEQRWVLAVIGIVLLALPLLILISWWWERRFGREISYHTPMGRISVNLQAVEEALCRAVEQVPGVRKVHVKVVEDRMRRQIIIEASLTLSEGENLTECNQHCQDILHQRFAELMPEQNAVQIHLTVQRLNHTRGRGASRTDGDATALPTGEEGQRVRTSTVATQRDDRRTTITPGLSATGGVLDNDAGARLLARARARRQEDQADGHVPREDQPAARHETVDTDRVPASSANGDVVVGVAPVSAEASEDGDAEEEAFDDLYLGPTYPVITDDEDDDPFLTKSK